MRECGFIQLAEPAGRCIGVGRRLKIGDELFQTLVAMPQASHPVVELRQNVLPADAAAGAEAAVVTKCTAADGDRAIDVGTSEAAVEADLVYAAAAETLAQKEVIRVVPQPRG